MLKLCRISILSLLCCLLLGLSPMMCSANQITLEELNRLEAIFNQLELNNKALESDLMQSKTELLKLKIQLAELKNETLLAKTELNQAQTSLMRVNQSLTVYEREVKSEIRKLKLQRDLVIVGVVAMAVLKR